MRKFYTTFTAFPSNGIKAEATKYRDDLIVDVDMNLLKRIT
jgi:hypothetical protein